MYVLGEKSSLFRQNPRLSVCQKAKGKTKNLAIADGILGWDI